MKQNIIISIVIFCLASVNVFALNNFVKEHKSNHHEFSSLFTHEDHHVQHSHGHVHKVSLVDLHSNDSQLYFIYRFNDSKPTVLNQWRIKSYPTQLFRPPIS